MYPIDVGHVQPSVPLGVGHVLTIMTSVPAGVISTTPVTVVSAVLPETTSNQIISQNDSHITMQILLQNEDYISDLTSNVSENISHECLMKCNMFLWIEDMCIRVQTQLFLGHFIKETLGFHHFQEVTGAHVTL